MLINIIGSLFKGVFLKVEYKTPLLGRWGYHWEQKIKYQIYYD